jgi:hypothetical protein
LIWGANSARGGHQAGGELELAVAAAGASSNSETVTDSDNEGVAGIEGFHGVRLR